MYLYFLSYCCSHLCTSWCLNLFAVLCRGQFSRQLFKYRNILICQTLYMNLHLFCRAFCAVIALCTVLNITNMHSCCVKCDFLDAAVVMLVLQTEQNMLGFGQILSWFQTGGFSCSLGRMRTLIQMQDNILAVLFVVVRNAVLQCRTLHSCGRVNA